MSDKIVLKNLNVSDLVTCIRLVERARIELQNAASKFEVMGIPPSLISNGASLQCIADHLVDVRNSIKTLKEQTEAAIVENQKAIDEAIKLLRDVGFDVNFKGKEKE